MITTPTFFIMGRRQIVWPTLSLVYIVLVVRPRGERGASYIHANKLLPSNIKK